MNSLNLVILGFGGHARSVADVALHCGYTHLMFIDDQAREGESFLGHPVQELAPQTIQNCFLAAGDNIKRHHQWKIAVQKGWPLVTIRSPLASFGVGSKLEEATFIGHHAHVGPLVHIGKGCVINTAAIVEHDCKIGDFSHISINSTVAGRVTIGRFAFIGAGATIRDGITISDSVIIGAGAVVVSDINEPGIYLGIPAKKIIL
jgi:UDP-N-acetylbacillosamine N-acetyltransferase